MKRTRQKRLQKVSDRIDTMPIAPGVEEAALDRFRETGEFQAPYLSRNQHQLLLLGREEHELTIGIVEQGHDPVPHGERDRGARDADHGAGLKIIVPSLCRCSVRHPPPTLADERSVGGVVA